MSSGLLDSSWDMDAAVLNLHDEHFGYCNESNELMGESSVFSSFVQELNHRDGVESTWILPDTDAELELESGAVEPKEDFKKTLEDWQQHVSNLQANDIKDPLSYDASEDMPDIFGTAITFPTVNVPKKKKVQKYVISKRNGLVIKLKKEDDDNFNCDNNKSTIKHKKNKVVVNGEKSTRVQIKEEKLEEFNLLNPSEFLGSVIVGSGPEVKPEVLNIKEEINFDGSLGSKHLDIEPIPPCKFEVKQEVLNIKEEIDFVESLDLKHLEIDSIPELEPSYLSTILSEFECNEAGGRWEDNPVKILDEKNPLKILAQPKQDITTEISSQPKRDVKLVKKSPPKVIVDTKQNAQTKTKVKSEINEPKPKIKAPTKSSKKQTESKVLPDSSSSSRAKTKAPVKTVQKQELKSSPINANTKPELKGSHKTTLQSEAKAVRLPKNTELKHPLKLKIKEEKAISREPATVKLEQKDLFLEELIKNERPAKITKKYKSFTSAKKVEPNKSIMECLPKEVIDRIKESSKRSKKSKVSLVPAEKLPVHGNDHLKDQEVTIPIQDSGVTSNGNLVKLDHNYCTGQQQLVESTKHQQQLIQKPQNQHQRVPRGEDQNRSCEEWGGDSKKDSGLESGEVSDASETHYRGRANCMSTTPPHTSSEPCQPENVQMIDRKEEASTESSDTAVATQEPKKKKLNLEEYRKLRKISKPRSPIKPRPIGWHLIPINQESINKKRKAEMVNAEVQVQLGSETKENVAQQNTDAEKKEEEKGPESYRMRSSSSSSCESKSRYRSRGRSKRRHHSRSQRSHWSYSRSRSRSRSRSSSCSYSSSSSRSRSRSSRGSSRRKHHSRNSYCRSSSYRRSSPKRAATRCSDDWSPVEKMRQVEERRVIYVGRLEEGTTKAQLRERFSSFGKIVDISLHFREKGDNYGFVTFAYKVDAYEAVEHGNDYSLQPKYDICFGGRRAFCKQRYSDLDGASPQSYSPHQQNSRSNDSFDNLLREAQKKLKRSSHV